MPSLPISVKSRIATLAPVFTAAVLSGAAWAEEELGELGELGEEAGRYALEPPDTSSPRATLKSFLDDAREAWTIFLTTDEPQRERYRRAGRRLSRAARCLDLSQLPPAGRREVAESTAIQLLDVLERIPLPPWREVPDLKVVEDVRRRRPTSRQTALASSGPATRGPRRSWAISASSGRSAPSGSSA